MDGILKFENLSTSYVSLVAFIRYLQKSEFFGRLHVVLEQYEADVILYGSKPPTVWESNHATGQTAHDEGALDRLLVRAREPCGLITVYEPVEEPTIENTENQSNLNPTECLKAEIESASNVSPVEDVDWDKLLKASGEIIAAVERAVQTADHDFAALFRTVGIEIGDDYPFLDPTLGGFEYSEKQVRLRVRPAASAYVSGLSECLRRIVGRVLADGQGKRFRERVAVELAVVARTQANVLSEFSRYLNGIAGTKVL